MFLAKILMFFRVWGRPALRFIQEHILPAIKWVDAFKKFVDKNEDFQKLLADIIGQDKLDEALDVVSRAIQTMGIGKKCLEKGTPLEIVTCFLTELKKQPKAIRNGLYMQLASHIAKQTSLNDTISNHEINALTNVAYNALQTGKLS